MFKISIPIILAILLMWSSGTYGASYTVTVPDGDVAVLTWEGRAVEGKSAKTEQEVVQELIDNFIAQIKPDYERSKAKSDLTKYNTAIDKSTDLTAEEKAILKKVLQDAAR